LQQADGAAQAIVGSGARRVGLARNQTAALSGVANTPGNRVDRQKQPAQQLVGTIARSIADAIIVLFLLPLPQQVDLLPVQGRQRCLAQLQGGRSPLRQRRLQGRSITAVPKPISVLRVHSVRHALLRVRICIETSAAPQKRI
jgi:hypothetical protein